MRVNIGDLPARAQKQVREKLARQGVTEHGLPVLPPAMKAPGAGRKLSDLEIHFDFLLRKFASDLPAPLEEHVFAPSRRFRFDRCWPDARVAVELDGGVMSGGRHVRPLGFTEDCVKLNLAACGGWAVLRFTSEMLVKDPQNCLAQLRDLLTQRASEPLITGPQKEGVVGE